MSTTRPMPFSNITNGAREQRGGEEHIIRTFEVMADGTCRPSTSYPRRRPTPPPPAIPEPGYDPELESFLNSLPSRVTWSPFVDDADLPPPLCRLPAPSDWHERFPPRSYWFDDEGVPLEMRVKWYGHDQASLWPFLELRCVTPDTVLAWHDFVAAYAAQLGGDENKENVHPRHQLAGAAAVLPATPTTESNLTPAAATAPTATPPDGSWAHGFGVSQGGSASRSRRGSSAPAPA